MVAKILDGFDITSNFLFVGLRIWYGRAVRSYATVPMVVKTSGTYETFNFFAILHMHVHINISTKLTKKTQQYIIFLECSNVSL
jgi:hypothetical protein